jgi:acetylornithine deacetylase
MRDILDRLLAFDTVSANPNIALMHYVKGLLEGCGPCGDAGSRCHGRQGEPLRLDRACGGGGVMLSGHTDVVPVEGQAWTKPPFALTETDGRYYGRGTADMKGFVACAIAAMLDAARRPLKVPLHLALSYDEEIGCMGVRSLIDLLARPRSSRASASWANRRGCRSPPATRARSRCGPPASGARGIRPWPPWR